MAASEAEDGTDFRPFFDMVIGILFVLLILVAAQIYFQQAEDRTVEREATKREAALRRAEIAAFLEALAARLHADGFVAAVDAENGAVLVPLRGVVDVDAVGLPAVAGAPADRLGADLASLTGCVTAPRSASPACSPFGRLGLEALAVTVRVGAVPPSAALPADRFGDLGSVLLSARMMSGAPALVAASNAAGGRVVSFGADRAGPAPDGAAEPRLGGDIVLDFTFR